MYELLNYHRVAVTIKSGKIYDRETKILVSLEKQSHASDTEADPYEIRRIIIYVDFEF